MTRASIDPLSNIIRPRRLDLRRDIRGFVVGPWPLEHAQSFLHELTHHWCFHSPLGTTLSLIRGQALSLLFRGEDDATIDGHQSVELFFGLATVDALLRFLRPLSEGIALFAEYDMAPGRSPIVTTPMSWASLMFAPDARILDISDPEQAEMLAGKLIDLRLTPASLRRKMGFLSRPLSPLDTAYYDGYLTVKRIFFDLLQQTDLIADTDLFLGYLRAYLFEDPGLVAILSRASLPISERLFHVMVRLRGRLEDLRDGDFADDIAAFAQGCNTPHGFRHDFAIPGLKITDQDIEGARHGFADLLDGIRDDASLPPSRRKFLDVQRGWLSRRSMATVFSEPALVRIGSHSVTVWPDPRDEEHCLATMGGTVDHGLPPGPEEHSGWYSLVLLSHVPAIAMVAGVGETVVALQWRSGESEPEPGLTKWLCDPINTPPYIEREAEAISTVIRGYFDKAPPPHRELLGSFHAAVDTEWSNQCRAFLRRWSSPASDAAADALSRRDRFRDLYHRDARLFETAVALSVLRSVDVTMPSTQTMLAEQGWDVGAALKRAIEIQGETGLLLLRNNKGSFEWTV